MDTKKYRTLVRNPCTTMTRTTPDVPELSRCAPYALTGNPATIGSRIGRPGRRADAAARTAARSRSRNQPCTSHHGIHEFEFVCLLRLPIQNSLAQYKRRSFAQARAYARAIAQRLSRAIGNSSIRNQFRFIQIEQHN